jgi:amino acid permease
LVRVPDTINSKNGQQVQLIQKWDGKMPAIKWVARAFLHYLIQKRIDKIKEKKKRRIYKKQLQQYGQLIGLNGLNACFKRQ